MQVKLEARDLVVGYDDGPPILRGVSANVYAGNVMAILGPNGAGKSTFAKAVAGLLRISEGQVFFEGEEITGLPPHKLVRRGIGYLPQLMSVFDEMTITENLEMGAYSYRGDLRRRIRDVLDLFADLKANPRKKAGQLSGGQQRMLALARTLMTEPRCIILDEPTAGLAPVYAARVWKQICRIRDEGVALFVVEQNVRSALSYANSACVLANGVVTIEGSASEVGADDRLGSMLVS